MGIISDLQIVAKVLQKAGNIELYNKVLDLQERILAVEKENQDLRDEIRVLKDELKIKGDLIFSDDAYWLRGPGEKSDGPFCAHCLDSQKKLIRLLSCPDPAYSMCPECNIVLPIRRGEPWKRDSARTPDRTEDDDIY